jgi:hypothetical protein
LKEAIEVKQGKSLERKQSEIGSLTTLHFILFRFISFILLAISKREKMKGIETLDRNSSWEIE